MRFRLTLALLAVVISAQGCKSSTPGAGAPADTTAAAGSAQAAEDSTLLAAADRDRILGADGAPVWLLIVSDFQCPYCRQWHQQSFETIVREYVTPGKVRLAYLNLPIGSHQNAKPAAEAAMCAGVQGKFWQVADGIFATQERWSAMPIGSAVFDSIAGAQAIDMPRWRECVEDHRTLGMVEADADRAREIGISSTPSFVVMRGSDVVQGISGAHPVETFRTILDSALAISGAPARP